MLTPYIIPAFPVLHCVLSCQVIIYLTLRRTCAINDETNSLKCNEQE